MGKKIKLRGALTMLGSVLVDDGTGRADLTLPGLPVNASNGYTPTPNGETSLKTPLELN